MNDNKAIIEHYNNQKNFTGLSHIQTSIVKVLWRTRMYPRSEIVRLTGLSRTTVFDNIRKINGNLYKRGIVTWEEEGIIGKRGRKKILYYLTDKFKAYMDDKLGSE